MKVAVSATGKKFSVLTLHNSCMRAEAFPLPRAGTS
jgi:hypothetical protein